jgi:lipid II:glycine glycyltransferase (peptidoglycan interpeptide bridge formation enzyme)
MPVVSIPEWDDFLNEHPEAHILQTSAWGEIKAAFGWEPVRIIGGSPGLLVGAQILFRKLPFGLSLAYIPKGPVMNNLDNGWAGWEALWPTVDHLCRKQRAIFLKIEPDLFEQFEGLEDAVMIDSQKPAANFHLAQEGIQPARTLLVDLRGSEEDVLGRMKQKTRYNTRLALKKGVVVKASADIEEFYRLMIQTGKRDAFGVHSKEYYSQVYDCFHPYGQCELLFAEYQGEPLAALMVFARGKRAWYFYGASSDAHRDRMPTYLLQWEAIRWARSQGCTVYDLWGVPDAEESALEAGFMQRADGLWGVYRFKRGFGGFLARASGPWDRVYYKRLYSLYRWYFSRRSGKK